MGLLIDTDLDTLCNEILDEYSRLQEDAGNKYLIDINDDETLLIEAFAYRINLLIQAFNAYYEQLFLDNATGDFLDKIALNYFLLKRETKSILVAKADFTAKNPSLTKVIIPKGTTYSTKGASIRLKLEEEVIFQPHASTASGNLIALNNIDTKDEIDIPTVYMREFVYSVQLKPNFKSKTVPEDDISLRKRCQLSLQRQSSIGTPASYEFFVRTADKRVKLVHIYTKLNNQLKVYIRYYADVMDAAMQDNIVQAFNNPMLYPVKVTHDIRPVSKKLYMVAATVQITEGEDITQYTARIQANISAETAKIIKIGQEVNKYQILRFIGIDNNVRDVKDLTLIDGDKKLVSVLRVQDDEIALLSEINIKVEYYGTSSV